MKEGRTVLLSVNTVELLKKFKVVPKQSYDEVVQKLCEAVLEVYGDGDYDKCKIAMWLGEDFKR